MTTATPWSNGYSFEPARITPGTLYHYIKSNRDGSYPARVSVYLPSYEIVEVLKVEAHGNDAVLVTAHMDWHTYTVDHLKSWRLTSDGVRHPMAELRANEQTITIQIGDHNESVAVEYTPWHLYNFDLISLNLIFRHRVQSAAPFHVGIYQPTFAPDAATMLEFVGVASIEWLQQAMFNNVLCDHYRISGAGVRDTLGDIWVNAAARHVESIEIAVPDHPDWDDFKFCLESTSVIGSAEWPALVAATTASLRS